MGRKIPGRKHRGVRDPEKQQQVRFDKIKSKINAPPTNSDNQDIPKSLAHLINLKEKVKSGEYNTKKRKTNADLSNPKHDRQKPFKKGPMFRPRTGESETNFLERMDEVCQTVIEDREYDNKIRDEIENGVTRPKKERKEKEGKFKKKVGVKLEPKPVLSKSQKRRIKINEKKEAKELIELDEFKHYQDKVAFGEVAHAPPTLVTPRRADKRDGAARPGTKDLLLKSLLSQNKENKTSVTINEKKKKSPSKMKVIDKKIDKKGKRKDLPNALRRQLDKQQSEIIQAYKDLKKKKYSNVDK